MLHIPPFHLSSDGFRGSVDVLYEPSFRCLVHHTQACGGGGGDGDDDDDENGDYDDDAASSLFYKEFENTLGILATYNEEVLILGDFNFHLEQSDNTDAQTFLNILRSHGFDSSTNQPTHNQGGWLDVIASRKCQHQLY